MRICHVTTTISRGGAENQLLILAELQVSQGDQVTIFPLEGELELLDSFLRIGAEVDLSLHKKHFLNQIFVCNFSQKMKYDVIHCHLPQAELLLALTFNKKPIISRHFGGAFYPNGNKHISQFLSRFATRKSRAVIAISKSVKEYLVSSNEISRSKFIDVAEYGFSQEKFLGGLQAKETLSLRNKKDRLFGTLARLSVEKDLITLIKAASIIPRRCNSNPNFKVYGDGPMKNELERQIKCLCVEDRVQLAGRTMDPAHILATFDVFVLTSQFEGFGMVLLEAMSLRLPIICSRIPSSVEIMGESGAALFFEPGDAFDLSRKIMNVQNLLASNYQVEQAKRLDLYNSHRMITKMNNIYRKSV